MRPTLSVIGGTLLLVLAAFMALGFVLSDEQYGAAATILAVAVAVVVPAATGLALIGRQIRGGRRLEAHREGRRLQTVESEILRLAGRRGGRLTLVEIVAELAIGTEAAQTALDSLVTHELADIAITDDGVLVYTIRDLPELSEKMRAKGLLES